MGPKQTDPERSVQTRHSAKFWWNALNVVMTGAYAYVFMCLFLEKEETAFLVYSVNFEAATGTTEAEEKNWEDMEEEGEWEEEVEEEEEEEGELSFFSPVDSPFPRYSESDAGEAALCR